MRLRKLLILLAAAGFASSRALADGADFVPRPTENGAFLDFFGSIEHDDSRSGTWPFWWTDTFFREKVTVYSNGYVYHPRFLQYHVAVGGALKQEEYRATSLESPGWRHASGVEYDTRLYFLPEHPYNLELFALRYEPLFKEQSATQHNSLQSSWGGMFRYRKKPWFFHAGYSDHALESANASSDVQRLGVGGEYLKVYRNENKLSLNAAYNPSRFSNSSGLQGSSTESLLGNTVDLKRVRLYSSLTGNTSDQEGDSSARFTNDQFTWYELLTLYLPLSFRSNISYRYQDTESVIPGGGAFSDRTLSDQSRNFQWDVIHRLYRSLDTVYTFRDNSRTSSGGETTFRSNALGLSYTKQIPWGRVLAGVYLSRGTTDNQGRADVVNEPHLARPVPGNFTLDQLNVEQQSVVVFVKSTVSPFQTIRLTEGTDYTVAPISNTLQITIFALPASLIVPGTYDFFVSYSLTTGEFGLRTDIVGYNASVDLFDTMLTPYYSYSAVSTDVVSGFFPGIPLDSTTRTAGLLYHRGPWRARGEYQNVQWEISPYHAWKGEVQYTGSLNPTTRLYATGTYLNRYFPQGSSIQVGEAYFDSALSASGSVQMQLLPRSLALSAGGSFSLLQGLVDTNAYSLNASLLWKVGKLDFTAGASTYSADTHGTTGFDSSRFHEYYYFNVRRVLF